MFRLPTTSFATTTRLIALLFALALAAAACSGSPDIEEVSGEIEPDADSTQTTETADDIAAEAEADAETDAMGEDDAMVDGDVDTTIAAPVDGAEGSTPAGSTLGSAELTAAFDAATSDRFSLPFMYLTVDQDCDGCAETMSLYYVPSEEKPSILTLSIAYIDGVAQNDFSAVDPSLQADDPRRIAEQLNGTDATYAVDPVSGIITNWTLGGDTVTLRCLQVDTRPVDMRTELCENSLIG